MYEFQSQSLGASIKILKSKWTILILVLLIISFAVGFSSGFMMGKKDLSNDILLPQPANSIELKDANSISGTISNISGDTFSISNTVHSIGTSPNQTTTSGTYQVETTSDTKILKIIGPIEPGELSAKTANISFGELEIGMLVKIETSEPISSSSLKAISIEAQAGVFPQQNVTAPPPLPLPVMPPISTQSAVSEKSIKSTAN